MAPIRVKYDDDDNPIPTRNQSTNNKWADEQNDNVPKSKKPGVVNFNKPDYCVHGAKYTSGYEDFVHKLFRPGDERKPTDPSFILNYSFPSSALPNGNLSASMQLKLEGYGADALTDSVFLSSTLGGNGGNILSGRDLGFTSTAGKDGITRNKYPLLGHDLKYYDTSGSTFPKLSSNPKKNDLKLFQPKSVTSRATYRKTGKIITKIKDNQEDVDYTSVPTGKYIYSDVDTLSLSTSNRVGDTRIVGSNFVMAASRPDDLFFNRIEKVLAEARTVNSWDI